MKTEREVLEEIFNNASIEDDIRAVCMNGSRVNKFIEPDEYQDFDIAFIVKIMSRLFNIYHLLKFWRAYYFSV